MTVETTLPNLLIVERSSGRTCLMYDYRQMDGTISSVATKNIVRTSRIPTSPCSTKHRNKRCHDEVATCPWVGPGCSRGSTIALRSGEVSLGRPRLQPGQYHRTCIVGMPLDLQVYIIMLIHIYMCIYIYTPRQMYIYIYESVYIYV